MRRAVSELLDAVPIVNVADPVVDPAVSNRPNDPMVHA